jgi:hypothetical protein
VIVNLVLVAVWFAIVARIAHHHRLLGGERPPLEAPAGPRRRLEPAGAGRA